MKVNYLMIVRSIYPQQLTKLLLKYKKFMNNLEETLKNEGIFNDCYSQIQLLDKTTNMSILNGGNGGKFISKIYYSSLVFNILLY
jgi:hypothetical protein